jgi:hypothetical protein
LGNITAFAFKKGNFRRPQHENETYMQEKEMGAKITCWKRRWEPVEKTLAERSAMHEIRRI